jgi:hypothetical protein
MFAYFYQFCLVIFLLQGFSMPFLPVISGVLWWRRSRQLESLEKELKLTRRKSIKRARSEEQKTRTKSLLFGAMEILEDFGGTFFFVSAILVGASMLLTIFYAVKNLL